MKSKMISLPIKKVVFSETEQSDLTKVTLRVCKEGLVPSHGIFIEKESLELAEESIKNKPLLCAYEYDSDGNATDFKGHEMEYKIIKEGNSINLKIVYLEQPVGIIPESCNFRIEDIDGENWIVVDAYLFNEYCSDAVRILEENDGEKSVSMEINVLESFEDEDDGLTHISKFKFTGVTLLGYNHPPAISGANITTFTQNETFALKFTELVERVNKIIEKGGRDLKRNEIIEKFSALKGNKEFENIISNKDLNDEKLEKALFSLSVNDLESRIGENLKGFTYSYTDCWGDTYDRQKYWLCDVLVAENIAIVEDNEDWYKHYGIPYELNGDSLSLKESDKKRYIRGDWRVFEEGEVEPVVNLVFEETEKANKDKAEELKADFEKTKQELNDVKSKFTDLNSEKVDLETKVSELKEFKEKFEKEQREKEVNEVLEKFEELSKIEGYEELISNKFEITKEELETKLKVFAFDNGVVLGKKKKAFSKGNDNTVKIPVGDVNNEPEGLLYNGILDKYIKR